MGFIVLESESVAIKAGVTATSRQASRLGSVAICLFPVSLV